MYDSTDKKTVLQRLTGSGPYLTNDGMINSMLWLESSLSGQLQDKQGTNTQEWMTTGELVTRFGISKSQLLNYITALLERGLVRTWTPISLDGKKGHTRYNVKDIEKAFMQGGEALEQNSLSISPLLQTKELILQVPKDTDRLTIHLPKLANLRTICFMQELDAEAVQINSPFAVGESNRIPYFSNYLHLRQIAPPCDESEVY